MKIDNFKDLEKLVRLMRKTGIDIAKVDGVELVLGSTPQQPIKRSNSPVETFPGVVGPDTPIETPDELTPEQLLMWSTGGTDPGNN